MLILVTGAGRGIGFETVRQLALEPGNLVIAVSRRVEPLKELASEMDLHNILPFRADITKETDLKKIYTLIRTLKTPLNVLINNAGEIVNKPFQKISQKELESVYRTNVFAPFMLIQRLIPLMNSKNRSHIVNISSMGGFQGSVKFPGLSAYSSSKAAIAGLTECLAEEFAKLNIAVNCLAIGAVQTEMLSRAFPGYKAPLTPEKMGRFISHFAVTGQGFFNGKILPVSSTTP
jgi:3-oxoacyl-[acyl-carrier protein] reductase